MKHIPSIDNILSDVEFELVQGAIARNEIGRAVIAVRQHHQKLRSEILSSEKLSNNPRELMSRQFQMNDSLIALIQNLASELQATRLEMRQLVALRSIRSATDVLSELPTTSSDVDSRSNPSIAPLGNPNNIDSLWQPDPEVEILLSEKELAPKLDAQPIHLPVLGGLLQRVRNALHQLSHYYTYRLAERQSVVNRAMVEQLQILTARVIALEQD